MNALKRYIRDLSIKRKMSMFSIALLLLLTAIFFWFSGMLARRLVLNRLEDTSKRNAAAIANYFEGVDSRVSERLSRLETSSNTRQLLREKKPPESYPWRLDALLKDVKNNNYISEAQLFNTDGFFVYGDGGEDCAKSQISRAQLEKILGADGCCWFDGDYNSATFTRQLAVYKKLMANGEAIGIAKAVINTADLSDVYNYVGFNTSSEIYLLSARGNVIAPKTIDAYLLSSAKRRFADRAGEKALVPETINGEKYMVYSEEMQKTGIYVISFSRYRQVIDELEVIHWLVYAMGAVCIVVVLLTNELMASYISKPIARLAENMREVEKGNLQLRINNDGRDEIARLSQSFDSMMGRLVELMNEIDTAHKQKHRLELLSLQTQITPHFLYNSLESVSSLVLLGDDPTAYTMANALSMFYRGVLSDGRSVIRLSEELDIAKNYLMVQSIRYKEKFTFDISAPNELANICIVKLTIQPLVENSIYHGIRKIRTMGHIAISAGREGDMAVITVADNGAGIASERGDGTPLEKDYIALGRSGFGMANVDQRLKLYFGQSSGISCVSAPGLGTTVTVRLKIRDYEERGNDFSFDC